MEFVLNAAQFAWYVIEFCNSWTNLFNYRNYSATLFMLLNLSTAMSSLMLPDVNCSHLGATLEITETCTSVTFQGLWRWGAESAISQRIAMHITETWHRRNVWATFVMKRTERHPAEDTKRTPRASQRHHRSMHRLNVWATLAICAICQTNFSISAICNNMHKRTVWATFAVRRSERHKPEDTQRTPSASQWNHRNMHRRDVWATSAICTIYHQICSICTNCQRIAQLCANQGLGQEPGRMRSFEMVSKTIPKM